MPNAGLNTNTRRPRKRALAAAGNAAIRSPRPRITIGPSFKNKGQSEPKPAAISASFSSPNRTPESAVIALNAATASLLPPPRPAPIGTRFCRKNFAPPRQPLAAANACAAFKTRLVSSTGTAGSSHANVKRSAPAAPGISSARNVSPNANVVATDTNS